MTEKLHFVCDPAECIEATGTAGVALLKELVAQIRQDSVQDSQDYLDETTVPHGGE